MPYSHQIRSIFSRIATITLVTITIITSGTAIAQTRYISDQLQAQLRAGTGTEFRIVASLTSGREVKVLEADAGNGYSKITVGNATGYILSRFLSDQPSPKAQLETALARVAPLQSQNQKLQNELKVLQTKLAETEAQNVELTATNGQLKQSLERLEKTSESAIEIDQKNRVLEEENINLNNEIGLIRQENSSLKNNEQQRWMMTGGAIAFLGLLAGLILPHLRSRQNSRYSNQL